MWVGKKKVFWLSKITAQVMFYLKPVTLRRVTWPMFVASKSGGVGEGWNTECQANIHMIKFMWNTCLVNQCQSMYLMRVNNMHVLIFSLKTKRPHSNKLDCRRILFVLRVKPKTLFQKNPSPKKKQSPVTYKRSRLLKLVPSSCRATDYITKSHIIQKIRATTPVA